MNEEITSMTLAEFAERILNPAMLEMWSRLAPCEQAEFLDKHPEMREFFRMVLH